MRLKLSSRLLWLACVMGHLLELGPERGMGAHCLHGLRMCRTSPFHTADAPPHVFPCLHDCRVSHHTDDIFRRELLSRRHALLCLNLPVKASPCTSPRTGRSCLMPVGRVTTGMNGHGCSGLLHFRCFFLRFSVTAARFPKGGLLASKRSSLSFQKTAFQSLKDRVSECKTSVG